VGGTLGQGRNCNASTSHYSQPSGPFGYSKFIAGPEVPGWRCDNGQCVEGVAACIGGTAPWQGPRCSDGSDESTATCCASTCPSDPDICIEEGQEILPGQDCRDCTHLEPDSYGTLSVSSEPGWRCNSGHCVQKWEVCNGYQECPDGSDESSTRCCASTCPSDPDICIPAGQKIEPDQNCRDCTDRFGDPGWRCNSGQCVRKNHVCNGYSSCRDGSDKSPTACCASTCPSDPDICIPDGILPEEDCRNCNVETHNPASKPLINPGWRCNSGQCVYKWKVCDGSPDCSDGSDESPAACCPSTCPTDPDICIPAGIVPGEDCRNCTVETHDLLSYGPNGTNSMDPGWRCNSGECLGKSLVCDGSPDCPDGSDESPAACCASTCPSDPDICVPAGQEILSGEDCRDCTRGWGDNYWTSGWRCNSGECLFTSQVCDGVPQCQDGSDESTFFNLFCRFG